MEAGGSSFWYNSNRVDQRASAYDDAYRGWSDVLRTVCGSVLSYLHLPVKKHSLCLDLTVFGVPIQVRMQSDAGSFSDALSPRVSTRAPVVRTI